MTPEEIQNLLIYRDGLILVLNKPSGIPVHKGSGKLESIDVYFEHLKFGLPKKPELAHRLDKDTSGCLVLGRHAKALSKLGELFTKDKISKKYLAIVVGRPENDEGVINLPLALLNDKKYLWWMKVDENGKESITKYKVLKTNGEFSLVELTPVTGRTHQLRVHMAHIGHHIYGDWIYGNQEYRDKVKLMLHAYSIDIHMNPKKDPISVCAEIPEYFIIKP